MIEDFIRDIAEKVGLKDKRLNQEDVYLDDNKTELKWFECDILGVEIKVYEKRAYVHMKIGTDEITEIASSFGPAWYSVIPAALKSISEEIYKYIQSQDKEQVL